MNDKIEVFSEYFDLLWALYDTVKSVLFLDFEVIEGSRGCSKKMQCALRL